MNRTPPFVIWLLKNLLWAVSFVATVVMILTIIGISSDPFSGNDLILGSLLFGFVPFLDENISRISWNAATWVPGLGAFVIATLVAHRYLTGWASRTGRAWNFFTSFCLVMIVPVLFVISFIVPGVLLQWEALRETVWINVR